jgi:hypothetical protein
MKLPFIRTKFDREWEEARNRLIRTIGRPVRFGDDWYLVTIHGQTGSRITGHVWGSVDDLRE